jgi:cystathionine beta-lyase
MAMKYEFDRTLDHRKDGSFKWGRPGLPDDVIGMGTADLDYTCAPEIREALVPVAEENCYNYRQHPEEYFTAAENWYRRKYGLEIKREWLSNVPSTIGAVRIALGTFASPGDKIIVQSPLFGPIATAAAGAGLEIIRNPLRAADGRFEIDFDDFEKKLREKKPKIFVLINPQNPTGKVYTKDELTRLVDLCSEYGVIVVSDEVHGLITYPGHDFFPLLSVSDKAREIGIQITSLSKGFNVMSLPHAIIVVPNDSMREPWTKQLSSYSFTYAVNSFSITAATTIMSGKCDEWLKELTTYLEANVDAAMNFFSSPAVPVTPYRPEGGYLMWIDCRNAGIGTERLDRYFLEKAHIDLDDGLSQFGPGGEGFIRINLAVTHKVLEEALARFEKVLVSRS